LPKKNKRIFLIQVDWGCLCGCNHKSLANNITNTHITKQKQKQKKTMQKKKLLQIVVKQNTRVAQGIAIHKQP
jgi:hypothetical protein